MIRELVATLVLVSPCLVGCGGSGSDRPELVPVKGTVTFKDSPVEGATVTFFNANSPRSASGITDAAGKFQLTTFDTNDGAVPGEHTVTISKVEASADAPMSGGMSPEQIQAKMKEQVDRMKGNLTESAAKTTLPAKYADPKTSGETRTVVKGDANDFKFQLTD